MRIYIKSLEPMENRYTSQWKISIPKEIEEFFRSRNKKATIVDYKDAFSRNDDDYYNEIEIVDIEGDLFSNKSLAENGAFLNFNETNFWKSSQLLKVTRLINSNMIKKEDKVLVTDAWDPTILQLKYMISLDKNLRDVKILGIWHAGSYDENDFLGRIHKKDWIRNLERSLYYAIDHNIFATEYHARIFTGLFVDEVLHSDSIKNNKNLFIEKEVKSNKIVLSGQPHALLVDTFENLDLSKKENIVLFPHRLAPEKQLHIFEDLANEIKDYKFIICQEKNLTKKEYHELLSKSKMVFSANLQETLGIAVMEGILANNLVVVPDRLSYTEMYDDYFKYPSEWTTNFSSYLKNKSDIVKFIRSKLQNYDSEITKNKIEIQKNILKEKYLNAKKMYEKLL